MFDNMVSGALESENLSVSFQITPISKPGKTISSASICPGAGAKSKCMWQWEQRHKRHMRATHLIKQPRQDPNPPGHLRANSCAFTLASESLAKALWISPFLQPAQTCSVLPKLSLSCLCVPVKGVLWGCNLSQPSPWFQGPISWEEKQAASSIPSAPPAQACLLLQNNPTSGSYLPENISST